MRRGNKRKIDLNIMLVMLCLISIMALVLFVFFSTSSHKYKKMAKERLAQIQTLETEKGDQQERLDAVQAELEDKKAYIQEWDDVYQQMSGEETDTLDAGSNPDTTNALYQDLYVKDSDKKANKSGKKIVHLTFDDGPSEKTGEVLDTLDKYNIKATFFVTYTEKEELKKYYKEIVDRGHTIAIHTASHDYKKIYASVDAYLEDFNKIYQLVYAETGVRPTIFRYPGGSLNLKGYSAGPAIKNEMDRRGFVYFDWNVSSGDGSNRATEESILQWITEGVGKYKESIVLMHDTRAPTVAILPQVIEKLTEMECSFDVIDSNTKRTQFYDKNY